MPSPKACAAKFKKGSQAYKDCIAYKGQSKGKQVNIKGQEIKGVTASGKLASASKKGY